jgi:hypothetical protein
VFGMVIVATLLIHLGDSRLNAAVPINSRFQSRGSNRQTSTFMAA